MNLGYNDCRESGGTFYKEYPNNRGCRVDIDIVTGDGEQILVEVQMSPDKIVARNIYEYAQIITLKVNEGVPTNQVYNHLPKVIVINLCDFIVRKSGNDDFLQPVKQMYTKNPEVAEDYLNIYNIQLPVFRKNEHDYTKPLYGWLYILDTANNLHISVEEVIKMHPELSYLLKTDPGMNQFINRYKTVSARPIVRSDTDKFLAERFRESSQRRRILSWG
jgi:predicted transposase/invertase (TIGR01784 family)